jgi:glycerol-3-phosphate acyltransferase PlsX
MSRFQTLREEVRRRQRAARRVVTTVALDAMGTDHGPEELLQGAFEAVEALPLVTVIATGPRAHLEGIIAKRGWRHPRLQVEDATEVVGMDELPKDSLRKENSSISVAARLVSQGRAGGLVSAGNTGATMAAVIRHWRRLPGISRPAVSAHIPHPKHPCIFLDVGANVDCRPRHLLDFAIMGHVYAHYMFHRRNPRVGLLSIGEEDIKGNEQTLAAQQLLRSVPLNFCGNAEGRDLFLGKFDVVVCDGFVGNVLLKFGEGLVEFVFDHLKAEVRRNALSQLGALAMMPVFRSFKKMIDASEYGGAPLLGLNGTCIICHGSSQAKSIRNAIRVAADFAGAKINEHIVQVAAKVHEALARPAGEAAGGVAG